MSLESLDNSSEIITTPHNPYKAFGREPYNPVLSDAEITDMLFEDFYGAYCFTEEDGYNPAEYDITTLLPDILYLAREFQKEFACKNFDTDQLAVVLEYMRQEDSFSYRYDEIGLHEMHGELMTRGQIPNKVPGFLWGNHRSLEDMLFHFSWDVRNFLDPELNSDHSEAYQLSLFQSEDGNREKAIAMKRLKAEIDRIMPDDPISYNFGKSLIKVIAFNAISSRIRLKFNPDTPYHGTPKRFQLQ